MGQESGLASTADSTLSKLDKQDLKKSDLARQGSLVCQIILVHRNICQVC